MDISINNLKKFFNRSQALNIDKLVIPQGDIIGLVGNNGSGKTTLMRLMIDLIKADDGQILLGEHHVQQTEQWKKMTSAYLDPSFLIDFLTAEEYFQFIGQCYEVEEILLNERIEKFMPLMNDEILNKKKYIRDFSAGNKQKIGIIGALLPLADIVLLDEPFNYLDPSSQYFLQDYLLGLNKDYGTTIIVSSHNLDHMTKLSSRIVVLEKGLLIQDIKTVNSESITWLEDYFHKIA